VASDLRTLTDPSFPGSLALAKEPWIENDRLCVIFHWPPNSNLLDEGDWAVGLSAGAVASVLSAVHPILTYLRVSIGITFGAILSEVCMRAMLVCPALPHTRVWFFDYLDAIQCDSSSAAHEAEQIWLFAIMLLSTTIDIMKLASSPPAAALLSPDELALVEALAAFGIQPPGLEGFALQQSLNEPLVLELSEDGFF
jgi:hypothetical protein